MLTAVAAGEPPNGARMKDYMVTDLARRNAMLDVTDWYARDRAEMEADDYFESLLGPFKLEGRLYGLPWHVYYYIMYYNKALMTAAGVSKAPDTWEEVIAASEKITDRDNNIYGTQMMTYSGGDAFMTKVTEMWARQHSDTPQTDPWDVDDPMEFNLTSPSMKAGLNLWLDMMYERQVALPPELSTLQNRTEGGLIAFWFSSAIGASEMRKRGAVEFDVKLLPKAKHRTSIVEVNGWGIFANTGSDEMTWELAKWATGPEVDEAWSTDGVYLPVRKTAWNKAPFNSDHDYIVAREQLEHPDTVFHSTYTKDWYRVMGESSAQLEEIYYRRKTVDQGLKDAQEKVEAVMKELYPGR
jgi:ABC-type glycerol-3-phosphate transport system substrate-binding protein